MMELGALIVVFIIAMVLVLAIRAEQETLRTVMQVRSHLRPILFLTTDSRLGQLLLRVFGVDRLDDLVHY